MIVMLLKVFMLLVIGVKCKRMLASQGELNVLDLIVQETG